MEALKGPHHDFICSTDRRMSQHRMVSSSARLRLGASTVEKWAPSAVAHD